MKSTMRKVLTLNLLAFLLILSCDFFNPPAELKKSENSKQSDDGLWTWISGSNLIWQDSIISVNSIDNTPATRFAPAAATDNSGNFWLFGGFKYGPDGGALNDLWKFDGEKWIFISGSTSVDQPASYGINMIASPSNNPGARSASSAWVDLSGNFWLFGGQFFDSSSGKTAFLNDLWKFDGTNWTWITGNSSPNQSGYYGEKNIAGENNTPGARNETVSMIDSLGNFWLFGGWNKDNTETSCYCNDLWKFDGTNWTWISGNNTSNQTGIYGVLNESNSTNTPGARKSAGWIDKNNNLYFFGGYGYDNSGGIGYLNDLWKFDGTNWTWISGSKLKNSKGIYNEKGTANSSNVPGARIDGYHWIDDKGDLWLFGGLGFDGASFASGILNDLWKFDGTNWTWIAGYNIIRQIGSYGEKSIPNKSNLPGARYYGASFKDRSGNFWLFGGFGLDADSSEGGLNDLWRYNP